MMHTLNTAIGIAWITFWVFWLVSAAWAKQGTPGVSQIRLERTSAAGPIRLRAPLRGVC